MTRRRACVAGLLALCAALPAAIAPTACFYTWPDPDGGAASPSPVDGGGCAGALVCDGFDDANLAARWTVFVSSPGGTVEQRADPSAPSAPNVLFTQRDAQQAPPGAAFVAQEIRTPIRRATVALSVRNESVEPDARGCVAGFVFNDGSTNEQHVRVLLGAKDAIVQENVTGTYVAHRMSETPPLGAWTRLSLSIEVGGHIVVHVADRVALDIPAAGEWQPSTLTKVFVGINFVETPTLGVAFRVDDVRVDGS